MQKPDVKIKEIVEIGEKRPFPLRAVVYSVNHERIFPYDIEVAYHQDGYKWVKKEVIWDREIWKFKDILGGFVLGERESYEFAQILKNRY